MSVEYPTFWTFRASIMIDIVYTVYTNWEKKVGYILEPHRMIFLYLFECTVSRSLPWGLWRRSAPVEGFQLWRVWRRYLCGVSREDDTPGGSRDS